MLSETLNQASNDAETKKRLAGTGAVPLQSSPQAFASFLRTEVGRWKSVVDAADIKID